jgi:polysaccharide export outer membrane protein
MKSFIATAVLSGCLIVAVASAQEPGPRTIDSSATTVEAPAAPAAVSAAAPTLATATPATADPLPEPPADVPFAALFSNPPPSVPAATRPATALGPLTAEMANGYQIGPEDVLDISVWKNPELSRTVPVRPDGKVSLPLVNDIQASGLTPIDLREQVTAKLAEFIPAPEVSVIVREVHSRKVTVAGAVKLPGRYDLRSSMTVLEVIALAQGLTDFASRDRIVILRQNGQKTERIPFNYRRIADSAQQDNFLVRPGDIVFVP